MKLILLGAPGAGKGTIAQALSKRLGIPTISTGDIFRQNIAGKTPLGKLAKEYMDKGELVPDDVVTRIVESRLVQPDCMNGFILDGFPRTIVQAKAFDGMMKEHNERITAVIDIQLEEAIIVKRLANRRVCEKCGFTYNIQMHMPSKDNICDACGGKVSKREDDNEETVKNRLAVYHEKTKPLIDYYQEESVLIHINNQSGVEESITGIIDQVSKIQQEA
jgi:adenylate kinase